MRDTFLLVVNLAGLCALAAGLLRLRHTARLTTMAAAWWWTWLPWLAAATVVGCGFDDSSGRDARSTYAEALATVLAVGPFVAALGARRPTLRAWPFFVVLPVFAVLCWPVFSVALATRLTKPLVLEGPAVAMYLVVLAMSFGNYLGTRLVLPVCAFGASLAAVWIVHSEWSPTWFPAAAWLRTSALISGLWAVEAAACCFPIPQRIDPFDRTLIEFWQLFGIVWGRRIQDRLNAVGRQHRWPGEFVAGRGRWTRVLTSTERAAIDHTLRWLLRRFVDDDWLTARLGHAGPPIAKPPPGSIDS